MSLLVQNPFFLFGELALSDPHPFFILPFIALLLGIALGPFLHPTAWERFYPHVCLGLGFVVVVYYLAGLHDTHRPLHTLIEYISFVSLIGSLFVVSGGIHITVKGEATPSVNVVFLLIGALLANLMGTTGASMLLIRPWIRMNKYRITRFHIVFFIFIVSNCGGTLTPIGDPPLFLGYLKGVPFGWVLQHCWKEWMLAVGLLLSVFYLIDRLNFQRAPRPIRESETARETWKFQGIFNLFFLGLILTSVFLPSPPFLRESLMLIAALGSYFTTPRYVHENNDFHFGPLREVALLFLGIFATMMPALDYLQLYARSLGLESAWAFYWGSGALSSVLDNAPTYLSFLYAQFGLLITPETMRHLQALIETQGAAALTQPGLLPDIQATLSTLAALHPDLLAKKNVSAEDLQVCYILANQSPYLIAISLGSVFFGAMTYIGNGPNLMVKSIASHAKVHTPHFVAYIYRYSLPVLLPILAFVGWFSFLR